MENLLDSFNKINYNQYDKPYIDLLDEMHNNELLASEIVKEHVKETIENIKNYIQTNKKFSDPYKIKEIMDSRFDELAVLMILLSEQYLCEGYELFHETVLKTNGGVNYG